MRVREAYNIVGGVAVVISRVDGVKEATHSFFPVGGDSNIGGCCAAAAVPGDDGGVVGSGVQVEPGVKPASGDGVGADVWCGVNAHRGNALRASGTGRRRDEIDRTGASGIIPGTGDLDDRRSGEHE